MNAHLAGLEVPLSIFPGLEPDSPFYGQTIRWTDKGFPDFSPWVQTHDGMVCDVIIEPTGPRRGDARASNQAIAASASCGAVRGAPPATRSCT